MIVKVSFSKKYISNLQINIKKNNLHRDRIFKKKASVINKQDKILMVKTIIKFTTKTIFQEPYHYWWPYEKSVLVRYLVDGLTWHKKGKWTEHHRSHALLCYVLLLLFFFFPFMFSHRLLHYLNTLWGLLPFYHSGVLVPLLHPKDGKFSCTIPQMKLLCID